MALDLADKASRPRPGPELVPIEDFLSMDFDLDGGWVGIWEFLHLKLT